MTSATTSSCASAEYLLDSGPDCRMAWKDPTIQGAQGISQQRKKSGRPAQGNRWRFPKTGAVILREGPKEASNAANCHSSNYSRLASNRSSRPANELLSCQAR